MRPEKLWLYTYNGEFHTEDEEFAFLHGLTFALGERDAAKPGEYPIDDDNDNDEPDLIGAYNDGVEFGQKFRELIYTQQFNMLTHSAEVYLTAPIYPYTSTKPMTEAELRSIFRFPE